ncbi:unnamed protein product, partial [Staurois parvus]
MVQDYSQQPCTTVTNCDQSQLSQYFSMAARMQPERRRNDC